MAERGDKAMVVLNEASVPYTPRVATISFPTYRVKRKQSGLWRESQATCRVLVLDFTDGNIVAGSR